MMITLKTALLWAAYGLASWSVIFAVIYAAIGSFEP
jgi:hypothetical protein